MIDLSRTRAELLAEIGATDSSCLLPCDITDARVTTRDAHVRLSGRGRTDLFPILKLALSERFAAVPRLNLALDLLMPMKNALGNACKHGNGNDPAKTVSVELVLTRKGAFVAVTDEGPGFDVALTFRRFQEQQEYFEHFGIGFRNLHRAASTVSYENGGRTVLLCFRPRLDEGTCGNTMREIPLGTSRSKTFDAAWVQTYVSSELPELRDSGARPESCRIYLTDGPGGDDCGSRYLIRAVTSDGVPHTRTLTGRFHTTEAAAKADFENTARLHEAQISKSVLIPRPMARPAREPCLVLYDFDPWLDLTDFLIYRGKLKAVRHFVGKFGRMLARLHRSRIAFPAAQADVGAQELQAMIEHGEAALQCLPAGSALPDRFGVALQRMLKTATFDQPQPPVPIHGALTWDCIRYGVDGDFYLYRFDSCRLSDPRLDLGGFLADLLCFNLATSDLAGYRVCSEAFIRNYNSKAEYPAREDALQPYILLALCRRLQRLDDLKTFKFVGSPTLAAVEALLCQASPSDSSMHVRLDGEVEEEPQDVQVRRVPRGPGHPDSCSRS